jgi:hypothetical protein
MTKSKSISESKSKELVQISDIVVNSIVEDMYNGKTAYELAKQHQIKLKTLYQFLEQNPKIQERFSKAQEIGIKTLIEKMLVIFDTENPNLEPADLLFIREKKDFLKFLAPRISSLYQEKKNLDIKSDGVLRVMWEDTTTEQDIIDITNEIESKNPIPLDNKGTD